MLYTEPDTGRFLEAVERLKRLKASRDLQTRLAKRKLKALLRGTRRS